MSNFQYLFYAQEVLFGPGSLKQINEVVERFSCERILLCTTKSFRSRGYVDQLNTLLGDKLVLTYDQVLPHVQDYQVEEILRMTDGQDIDAVIGLGGGSAIGVAKAMSAAIEERKTGHPAIGAFPTDQPLVPVIAIPTTYAGSEMTAVYGVTRQVGEQKQKVTVKDVKVTPKLTIYDPELTLDLPPHITAGTGINAFAHCIEAIYSTTSNPLSTKAALGGIRDIWTSLPECHANGTSIEARTNMLQGAFLAGVALSNVAMCLHHGICHVLGGTAGLSHGDANSIMLPHVMRFNLAESSPQLAAAAEAMGLPIQGMSDKEAGELAANEVAKWIKAMNIPYRLRDVGVSESSIPQLAEIAFQSKTVRNNPTSIEKVEQLEELLRNAW